MYNVKKGLVRINILTAMINLNKPVKAFDIAQEVSKLIDYPISHRRIGCLMEELVISGKVIRYKQKIKYGNRNMEETPYTYELNQGLMK